MDNEPNPYDQSPQNPEMMPMDPMPMMMGPMLPPPKRKKSWKDRVVRNFGRKKKQQELMTRAELIVPQWLVGKSVLFFFIAYAACRFAFGHPQPLDFILVAFISVVLFFFASNQFSRNWARQRERTFLRNVFIIGFAVRLLWVLYLYFFFNPKYFGSHLGSDADTGWYIYFGKGIANWITDGFPVSFNSLRLEYGSAIDDVGYPIWLAIVYLATFKSSDIFIPFVLKSILDAYAAICIYRVTKRHFDVGTARMAALFCMLNPNLIYWCGTMMKETEMVFLCCLFLDKADATLSTSNKLGFRQLVPALLIGLALMFMRTALGLVAFMAIFAHIVFVSRKVMSNGKKILAGVLVVATVFMGLGDRFISQSREHLEQVESGGQQQNMEWRSKRKGGNSFAKYAGAAVFAPLIFTIPFPTFNRANSEQIVQPITSGGSYIRNVLSFFVILVMILLVASGEWRKHVFILAYTCGYLAVLVVSGYAQSGRFHMPIWPMLMVFAAFGIQVAKDNKRVRRDYNLVLLLEIIACLGWNWFKLKGRGMI